MDLGKSEKEFDNLPLLSIGVPVFNAELFLEPLLSSIFNQHVNSFEIIFVDDCSSDASFDILQSYSRSDPRIKVYRNPKNLGVAVTRSEIVSHAKGKIFLWADSDDEFSPGIFSLIVSFFSEEIHRDDALVFNAEICSSSKEKRLYGRRARCFKASSFQKLAIVGTKILAYPWTVCAPLLRFQNIEYPVNSVNYVDDQLVFYRYFQNIRSVYYVPAVGYRHFLRSGTDSHSPLFFKRLSNTYSYLVKNLPISLAECETSLAALSLVYLGIYLSHSSARPSIEFLKCSVELKKIHLHVRDFRLLGGKNFIFVKVLSRLPRLFFFLFKRKRRF